MNKLRNFAILLLNVLICTINGGYRIETILKNGNIKTFEFESAKAVVIEEELSADGQQIARVERPATEEDHKKVIDDMKETVKRVQSQKPRLIHGVWWIEDTDVCRKATEDEIKDIFKARAIQRAMMIELMQGQPS